MNAWWGTERSIRAVSVARVLLPEELGRPDVRQRGSPVPLVRSGEGESRLLVASEHGRGRRRPGTVGASRGQGSGCVAILENTRRWTRRRGAVYLRGGPIDCGVEVRMISKSLGVKTE